MTDLRSGLCHGPNCQAKITEASESEDFCGDDCQTAWHARHAHPELPPLSVHLPAPAMARWTPEGGAPVTPETSTWTPRPDALGRYARDRWGEEGADRWASDVPITDPGPLRTRLSIVPPTERPSATGGWVQLDDSDYPDWAWTDVSEHVSDAYGLEQRPTVALRRPFFTAAVDAEVDRFMQSITEDLDGMAARGVVTAAPSPTEGGDILADCKPCDQRFDGPVHMCPRPPERSLIKRLWRWVWFRG